MSQQTAQSPMSELLNNPETFRSALSRWYAEAKRPLPWRTDPSLYRTVVSECMLQQTQVKTMLPYYHRWVNRFPGFRELAAAPAEEVLKHWEGLGYYSRARNLHKLAKVYITLDPKPATAAEWQTLPGIGPYTSAAISSIAQGYPAAVVDGNVVRILARLTNDQRTFQNNGQAVTAFRQIADDLLAPENPGEHNQAMMELGATVCLKRGPLCTVCPVVRFCSAAAQGRPEALPQIKRKPTEQVKIDRFWIRSTDRILLHRIPETASQLAGQYELPAAAHLPDPSARGRQLMTKTRSITHRRIRETIYAAEPGHDLKAAVSGNAELFWVELDALEHLTLSGPHRRWVKELLKTSDAEPWAARGGCA